MNEIIVLMVKFIQPIMLRLNPRERLLASLVFFVSLLFMLDSLILSPYLASYQDVKQKILDMDDKRQIVQTQLFVLQGDSSARNHAEQYKTMQQDLVLARDAFNVTLADIALSAEMHQLIKRILKNIPGVRVIEVKKTTSKLILAEVEEPPTAASTNTIKIAVGQHPSIETYQREVYQHSLRIKWRGEYDRLVEYLDRLERDNLRVFWDRVKFQAIEYPVFDVTVNLFIISTSSYWLD